MSSLETNPPVRRPSWFSEGWGLYKANWKPLIVVGALSAIGSAPIEIYSWAYELNYAFYPIMLRLYFPLMFVSSLFFSPAIILGVRCVQTGKVEIADMWPGGRRYLLVTLYVALCTAVIQTCYWMWYVPALFVYPLFLLGLTYISTGDGFGVSIRKSIHYATRSYGLAVGWTFLYLMLRIICNYTIVGPIFSAPFTVLLLGLAARDFGDLKVYVGNPLSHDDFSNPLSIQGAWPPPPVSLSQEKPEESKDNDPPWNKEM